MKNEIEWELAPLPSVTNLPIKLNRKAFWLVFGKILILSLVLTFIITILTQHFVSSLKISYVMLALCASWISSIILLTGFEYLRKLFKHLSGPGTVRLTEDRIVLNTFERKRVISLNEISEIRVVRLESANFVLEMKTSSGELKIPIAPNQNVDEIYQLLGKRLKS